MERSLEAERALAAESLAAAFASCDEAKIERAQARWDALQEGFASAVVFDPRLHPRNRMGQFRQTLLGLGRNNVNEIDLPGGLTVKKAIGGGYKLTDRSGRKLGRHMSADSVIRKLESVGVDLRSDRPTPTGQTPRGLVFAPGRVNMLRTEGIEKPKQDVRASLIAHLQKKGIAFPAETVGRIFNANSRYFWESFQPGPMRVEHGHVVSLRATGVINFPDQGRKIEVDLTYHSPIGKPGQQMKTLTSVRERATGSDVLRSEGIETGGIEVPMGGSANYADHLAGLRSSSIVSNWNTNHANLKAGVDRDGGEQRKIDMAQIELEMERRGLDPKFWAAMQPEEREKRIRRLFEDEQRKAGEAQGATLKRDDAVKVTWPGEPAYQGKVVKTNKDTVDVEVTRRDGSTFVARWRRDGMRGGAFSGAVSMRPRQSRSGY